MLWHVQLFVTLWTVALQAPLQRIFKARIPEWVAMPSSRGSSQPRDPTCTSYSSCTGRQVLYPLSHLGSRDANAEGVVLELRSHRTHAPPLPRQKKKRPRLESYPLSFSFIAFTGETFPPWEIIRAISCGNMIVYKNI